MKISDINENLTEGPISGPAGFKKRAKAKLQKNVPFAPGKRRRGAIKDKLFARAKEIKDELLDWKAEAFASGNAEKEPLTMSQFLDWLNSAKPELGAAVETVARADKAYADFFVSEIDSKGKETKTATDDKVKPRDAGDQSEEEVRAAYAKQGEELEAKRKAQGGELVDEDSEDSDEPEVDMSASIYESRLRAFLEEDDESKEKDVGINPSKTLADNQIDTLIVKGLEKLRQGKPVPSRPPEEKKEKEPSDEIQKTADKVSKAKADDEKLSVASPSSGGSVLDEYGDELEDILTTVYQGGDISKNQKRYAKYILDQL